MATVTAFIRTSKTDRNKSVKVRFRLRDGREFQIFHTSELLVIPDKWDEKQQTIKARVIIDETERKNFNDSISDRKKLITAIYSQKKKSLTSELLDAEIDKHLHPDKYEVEEEIQTFFQFADKFLREAPSRKDRVTGRVLTKNTLKSFPTTVVRIKEFAKSIKKEDIRFDDINQQFYDKFVVYLQDRKFAQNTVGKHIKILKTIMNEALRQGHHTTGHYNDFRVYQEEVDSVYLNESELQMLKDADFAKKTYLDHVRDWFLLLSWTGSRFSDLGKVAAADIKDGFITFRQQKTGTKVVIPVHPVAMDIFKKYDFKLPNVISNQNFNVFIKEACKAAGITSSETMTRTEGGKPVTTVFEKWQHVTSHTGRRCFATNMYKRGLPTLAIMSITGHKTEKSFLKYIKVKPHEHAELMAKAWENMYK